MSRANLAWLVAVPAVTLFGLAVAATAPLSPHDSADAELVGLVAEVLGEVEREYARDLTPELKRRFVEAMLQGGLERLDPHSAYLGEREFRQFDRKSRGSFGGIGVQIALDRSVGGLLVTSPIPGTPAYDAGLMPDDFITHVDGQSLEHKTASEAIDLVQGEVGTAVRLTIVRDGDAAPIDVSITRGEIRMQSVLGDRHDPNDLGRWNFWADAKAKIAHVRVVEFDEPTAGELDAVLTQLTADGVRGVVLDLRGNPGGLLSSAVEVSDLFLPEGKIVGVEGRKHPNRVFEAKPAGTRLLPASRYPIAVLIDRYSASAAEIVAAALQDHGRAVVVGERSYGKGSVQNVIPVNGGRAAVKLTTASYTRPSGRNIHRFPDSKEGDDWGVKPSPGFEVKLTDEQRRDFFRDRRKRDAVPGKAGSAGALVEVRDPVLQRALDHLRGEIKD